MLEELADGAVDGLFQSRIASQPFAEVRWRFGCFD
jgi:hypothetical protein